MLRTVAATRYVTPLREGGSLPAVVEADDDGLYVLKFRGAGQGPKALIAELVAGEVGRALGLPVPELVLVEVDPALARAEPDPEIQALVAASPGLNLALDYLPGSLAYDPAVGPVPDAALASAVVWFDALVTNVDRTARNTNLLVWHRQLWLIDHGATLYAHHRPDWPADPLAGSDGAFPPIRNHVLLPLAAALPAADAALRARLDPAKIVAILAAVPDGWFAGAPPAAHRAAYAAYLAARLAAAPAFLAEAERARALGAEERPRDAGRRPARRDR